MDRAMGSMLIFLGVHLAMERTRCGLATCIPCLGVFHEHTHSIPTRPWPKTQ